MARSCNTFKDDTTEFQLFSEFDYAQNGAEGDDVALVKSAIPNTSSDEHID